MSKRAIADSSDDRDGARRLSVDDVDAPDEEWAHTGLAQANAETRHASAGYTDREKTLLELWNADNGEVSFLVRTGPPLSDDTDLTIAQAVDMTPDQAEAFARDLLECVTAARMARGDNDE